MEKWKENLELIRQAVRCEKVDHVPVTPSADGYYARQAGITIREYVDDCEAACRASLQEQLRIEADATQTIIASPYNLGIFWMSDMSVPGRELPDDAMWQVAEQKMMMPEDYDTLIDAGWDAFQEMYVRERLNLDMDSLARFRSAGPASRKKFQDAGIPTICDFLMVAPFESLCGARTLGAFFVEDMIGNPKKVLEATEIMLEANLKNYRRILSEGDPAGVWIGGWRTSPNLISPSSFETFVWPSFKAYYDLCMEMNVIPIFHLDSDWTKGMEFFNRFDKKTFIVALDGMTDIRKAREILGPEVCIMGDVPCTMMTFGQLEEVTAYVNDLLTDIGPRGCIISTGCDIPSDAKGENVLAMSRAAHSFPVCGR
ncbi:MAG: uroporphyrinogen decarboxylase family protein [Emergencia sp.]